MSEDTDMHDDMGPGFDLGGPPVQAAVPAAAAPLAVTSPATQDAQAYRVLARKYRPQRFSELIGQDAMVTTLGNAIKRGRLAHAFLLTGVRGVGQELLLRADRLVQPRQQVVARLLDRAPELGRLAEAIRGHEIDHVLIAARGTFLPRPQLISVLRLTPSSGLTTAL